MWPALCQRVRVFWDRPFASRISAELMKPFMRTPRGACYRITCSILHGHTGTRKVRESHRIVRVNSLRVTILCCKLYTWLIHYTPTGAAR